MRRRGKFNAKRTQKDGIKFASKKEAKRYSELKLLERAGEIRNLKPHPEYKLASMHHTVAYPNGRIAKYTADFEYFDEKMQKLVVEDVKSKATMTDASKLRMAVFAAFYGIEVTIRM